jgi:hypothetical protein
MFGLLDFVIFGIISFLAILSKHVCAVALYRFVVLVNEGPKQRTREGGVNESR